MKKSPISKILLASLSIVILNSCNKSNDISTSGRIQDSTSTSTPSGQPFDLAYVIKPLTSEIRSITFNDENGNPKTVYDMDLFPGGILNLKVSSSHFKAGFSVDIDNSTNHPIGFRLEIRVSGKTELTKDFTISPKTTYTAALSEDDLPLN